MQWGERRIGCTKLWGSPKIRVVAGDGRMPRVDDGRVETRSGIGVVESIWLRPAARAELRAVSWAAFSPGAGLVEDHAGPGRREVTVLSLERWEAACRQLGRAVDPSVRRANLLVSGIDLDARRDARLAIGAMVLRVHGETRPCELLDDAGGVGLDRVLRCDVRGGIHGSIERPSDGGVVRVGDPVAWL